MQLSQGTVLGHLSLVTREDPTTDSNIHLDGKSRLIRKDPDDGKD